MAETDPLKITIDDSFSINQLTQLQAEGFSVIRSAHVGNLSPYNLALANAGIPILSVDHTVTGVDTNYFPESINTLAGDEQIAGLQQLVCRASVERLPIAITPLVNGARFVDEVHIRALRHIIPTAELFTNSDYLRANESVVGEVTGVARKYRPDIFQRIVTADGRAQKVDNAASLITSLGVLQLNDDLRAEQAAVIMPNELDIMSGFVIEALKTERTTQYHLSGPAMVQYIKGVTPTLIALYQQMRTATSFGAQLPEQLDVRLVPSSKAKFATTMKRQPRLDRLLNALAVFEAATLEAMPLRKAFYTSPDAKDRELQAVFEARFKTGLYPLEAAVAEAAAELPELLIEPGTKPPQKRFITQYDVLREGGLYVPPINRERSMAGLSQVAKIIANIRKKVRL